MFLNYIFARGLNVLCCPNWGLYVRGLYVQGLFDLDSIHHGIFWTLRPLPLVKTWLRQDTFVNVKNQWPKCMISMGQRVSILEVLSGWVQIAMIEVLRTEISTTHLFPVDKEI